MAEAFASDVAKQMLSKLISLAADEVSLAWGFKGELKRLKERLEMVQALLSDAAENKKSNLKAVGIWLKKLNAVAYDADAVLDEFTYETLRRNADADAVQRTKLRALFECFVGCFGLFSPSLWFHLKMAHKIRSINEALDKIYKEGTDIGLVQFIGATDITTQHSKIRLTHPYIGDSEVVGRDDDVSKIVGMLLCPDNGKNLMVIAIVGMAGQGKTTLAQLVCKHGKVKEHFHERIWVVVSEDFDELRLLNEMVQSLTGENPRLSNVEGIIENKLGKKLKGKRYLLVLDDVWSHDASKWETMRNALLEIGGSSGSRIMVTTRSDQVVSSMQTSLTLRLGRLSEKDSWTMFKHRAFAKGGAEETENLVDKGKEMVKRCGGLPLAIKSLGGLMYSRKSEPEWSSIQISRLWDREDNMGGVLSTLKLSYDHLPTLLKHCFAFCSIFPKDSNLEKSNLIQIWMALGLLHPDPTSNDLMEDIGSDYFDTLLLNSLLQDAKKDKYNSITSCKMHDVVHDLSLDTAKNYCSTVHASQLMNDVSDVVHLSLFSSLREIPEISKKICPRLQTLILKAGFDGKLLAKLKCLRVLVLDNYWIKDLPDSIGELKHLRYLDISKTKICSLPNSITKLYNLQTLKIRSVRKVPINFGSMINLRHFCIDWISVSLNIVDCMLIGIGWLTYLQTLPYFVVNRVRGCHIKELGSLKNLRGDLTIFGLEHVENFGEAIHADLSKKSELRTLSLCWGGHQDKRENKVYNDEDVLKGLEPPSNLKAFKIKNFAGGEFPSWMMVESQTSSVLRNLVKIKLRNCDRCEQIPPLGHLRYLKVVEIIEMVNVKVIGAEFYGKRVAGGGASSSSGASEVTIFPALRKLTLSDMPRLEKWLEAVQQSGSMSVFPCLETLNIERCSSLITIPCHFPSLRELSISNCDGFSYLPNNLEALERLRLLNIECCSSLSVFPCLEKLNSERCSSLITIPCHFPSLRELGISNCDGFSYLPNNLEALERLELHCCKTLRDIPFLSSVREVSILQCEKLIGLPSLTKLFPLIEKLVVEGCPNLLAFPEMHCHTSLRELVIGGCPKLTSLPELGTTLKELAIQHCRAMVSFPDFRFLQKLILFGISEELDYFPWPSSSTSTTCDVAVEDNDGIQCLKHVELKGWPEIKSLPQQLQHLSALTYLLLCSFDGLESLPEWLGNLSSLQSLVICYCKKLMYMPSAEAMRRLTNLSRLDIYACPLLEERCIEGSRPEWEKISHITTIQINWEYVLNEDGTLGKSILESPSVSELIEQIDYLIEDEFQFLH